MQRSGSSGGHFLRGRRFPWPALVTTRYLRSTDRAFLHGSVCSGHSHGGGDRFHFGSAAHPASDAQCSVGKQLQSPETHRRPATRSIVKMDAKDIFFGDLAATVAAHKATNQLAAENILRQKREQGGVVNDSCHSQPSEAAMPVDPNFKSEESTVNIKLDNAAPEYPSALMRRTKRTPPPIKDDNSHGRIRYPTKQWATSGYYLGPDAESRYQKFWPWLSEPLVAGNTSIECLSTEVYAFEQYMKTTRSEQCALENCSTGIIEIVGNILPTHHISSCGSRIAGLHLPLDELRFSVTHVDDHKNLLARGPSPGRAQVRKAGIRVIELLRRSLSDYDSFKVVKESRTQTRPELLLFDKSTGLPVRLMYGQQFHPPGELTHFYFAEHKELRPLYTVLMHALQIRSFFTEGNHGINAWTLSVMILTALRNSQGHGTGNTIGHYLLHVLKFWSEANLDEYGYAADPPVIFPKFQRNFLEQERSSCATADMYTKGIKSIAHRNWRLHKSRHFQRGITQRPYLLSLQDPAKPDFDLGAGISDIKDLQATFKEIYTRLQGLMQQWNLSEASAMLPKFTALLDPLVGANYTEFIARRQKLGRASLNSSQA